MVKEELKKLQKNLDPCIKFFKNKNVQNTLIILLFIALLIWSSSIRLQNLPLLKDQTTGEHIPLALDPFYFLRIAETMVSEEGLPSLDTMRYTPLKVSFSQELLPDIIVLMYKIVSNFSDVSIQYVDVIYPVVFYVLGLTLFFLLSLSLTKNKWSAIISSGFLAIIPPFLYRTTAGFSDHEAIGMFAFFLTLFILSISLKDFESKRKTKVILFSLLLSLASAFTIVSWGGIAKFIFMIIPLAFFIIWLVELKGKNKRVLQKYLIFYLIWAVFSILFCPLFGYSLIVALKGFILTTTGMFVPFLFLFLIINYILIFYLKGKIKEKHQIRFSIILTLIFGALVFELAIGNSFNLISEIVSRLLHPFGTGRIGLTVAENAQPHLIDWFSQIGKEIFWIFFLGIIFIGIKIATTLTQEKNKGWFILGWVVFISGLLLGRISSESVLNGENILSQVFYFFGALFFICICIWIYLKDNFHLNNQLIIIFAWMVPMLIAVRGAIRLFFAVVPFICFTLGYLLLEIYNAIKKSRGELVKWVLVLGMVFLIVLLLINFLEYSKTISLQAKYTGPSANEQWQKAMQWVRENTNEKEIFVHWWDYGYWVQYLGQRPTVTDGGHANGFWDHLIGRYVLTTPYPETAFAFMKAQNTSYLLIDSTDIGKYSAYSKIGSDIGGEDRYSWIVSMVSDPQQIQETSNGIVRIYQGGSVIDQDIIYEKNGSQLFLPAYNAAIGGVFLEMSEQDGGIKFSQPEAAFIYNGKQIQIPVRYLHYKNQIIDFGAGLDNAISLIPRIYSNGQGYQIDNIGAMIYLSNKTFNSLMGQVYILGDSLGKYPGLKEVHSEEDPLFTGNSDLTELVYFNGIRGPIKIYQTNVPEEIAYREEFLRESGEYAEFDNLKFTE